MTIRKKTVINYLSNTELLYEINKSKKSYSYFIDKKYEDFTVIVRDLAEITPELIEEAKVLKAKKTNFIIQRQLILSGMKKSDIAGALDEQKVSSADINEDEIVFRLMTQEHIPDEVKEVKKTLLNRIKFPPFKHYAFVEGELKEVGRSHWVNGIDNGHFSIEKGKISDQLVKSMITLVNRYGSRGNFCGYSYIDDMKAQALLQSQLVVLQFDESKSDNPFAFLTQVCKREFFKILKSEKQQRKIRDAVMQEQVGMSSHSYQMEYEDTID